MADSSTVTLLTVEFPINPVYRIARRNQLLTASKIRERDSASQAGHRFDVLNGGVIYCATQLSGSFAEVLSPFRRAPSSRIHFNHNVDSEFMSHGSVPANWRELRRILRIRCIEPLPFLDLENPKTLAFLDAELAKELHELGVYFPLDVSVIRGNDRRITRDIKVSDPDLLSIAALYQLTIH